MAKVFVIAEHRDGRLKKSTFELLGAASSAGHDTHAILLGEGVTGLAAELREAAKHRDERLLDEVVDLARGPEDAVQRGVDPGELAPVQRALGREVVLEARRDQLGLILRRRALDDRKSHAM